MKDNSAVNIIEEEYALYDEGEVLSLDEIYAKIFDAISEATKYRNAFLKEDERDRVTLQRVRFWGSKLSSLLGLPSEKILEKDIKYLETQLQMVENYLYHLTTGFHLIDEENCGEISKLTGFEREKYFGNKDSVEELRKINKALDYGCYLVRYCDEENSAVVEQFVCAKLEQLAKQKEAREKRTYVKKEVGSKASN